MSVHFCPRHWLLSHLVILVVLVRVRVLVLLASWLVAVRVYVAREIRHLPPPIILFPPSLLPRVL